MRPHRNHASRAAGLTVLALAAIVFLISCQNQLLPAPSVHAGRSGAQAEQQTEWGAPQNVVVSQGLRQEVAISWSAVRNAARYYVYRAASPYDRFVQVGETADATPSYTLPVPAGSDLYYKITAVKQSGEESGFSTVHRGTSLAKPLISDISGGADADSSVDVSWYMGNADAYQSQVRYTVICADDKGTEVARVSVDGSATSATRARFTGLTPNTSYVYTVEAYLVSAQDRVERSDAMDAATARRLRPNPPENLSAAQSESTREIQLTFTLPDPVDMAVSSGVYEQKPLYFKIFRREKAQDGAEPGEFVPICSYFGYQDDDEAASRKNFGLAEYAPGETVTYTDAAGIRRGVVYEYKVQAFADDTTRQITSDLSCAQAEGWLIAPVSFRTGKYTPQKSADGEAFVSGELSFELQWEPMGAEGDFHFILEETRTPLKGDGEPTKTTTTFASVEELLAHKRTFGMAEENSPDEGYYRYSVHLVPAGTEDTGSALDTATAIGQVLVTRSVEQPVIEFFSVTNGYADKITVQWKYNATYKYTLVYIDGGTELTDGKTELAVDGSAIEAALAGIQNGGTVTYEHPAEPGTEREYILRATLNDIPGGTDQNPITGSTLALPSPEAVDYDYDSITVQWNEARGAAGYSVSAAYEDASVAAANPIDSSESLSADARRHTFSQPQGHTDAAVSGLPVTVTLTATSNVTRTVITRSESGDYVGANERVTDADGIQATASLSADTTARTVGPAAIGARALQSQDADEISVSWSKAEGAQAYAVIRNRLHIAPGGADEFQSTEKYIVDASGESPTVTQSGGTDDISAAVAVSLSGDGKFTLVDRQADQTDATSGWQKSQSQISWGGPYDYIVIPLVSKDDEPEYDHEQPDRATLNGTAIDSLSATRGSTLGYGWNVTATKGWQAAELSGGSTSAENTSVRVTWDNPSISVKKPDSYSVFRRTEGGAEWTTLSSSVTDMHYDDKTAEPGTVYEYAVGINNETDPTKDAAFTAFCDEKKDSVFTSEKAAAGFVLPIPEITSASRKALENNAEQIDWPAAKVGGENNRMIDGYVVEVLNHNISADWHQIAEVRHSDSGATATYTQLVDNSGGLLKVLRDYKHYFRIRAFREQDGKRTLSPPPVYEWSDGAENTHVKWGARQITAEEFCKMANLVLTYGLKLVNGTSWNTAYSNLFERDENADSPGTGSVHAESNGGVTKWDITYNNYAPALKTKTGNTFVFLTAAGVLNPKTGAVLQYPKSYDSGTITISSNNPMGFYGGTITYSGLTKTGGSMTVNYGGSESSFSYSGNSPLPFTGDDYHHEDDGWY